MGEVYPRPLAECDAGNNGIGAKHNLISSR